MAIFFSFDFFKNNNVNNAPNTESNTIVKLSFIYSNKFNKILKYLKSN